MKSIKNNLIFFVLFAAFNLFALQIKISHLAGSKATFTLFDSFAPIIGGFIGTTWGVLAVVTAQITNFLLHGSGSLDVGFLIRLVPTVFAVLYFAQKSKANLIIPIVAIIGFVIHPIGKEVWYYSVFWLIPLIVYPFHESLIAKSLGATFTAHAIGGVFWIYAFNLPKEVWIGLIPIVIIERLLFALGMAVNYKLISLVIASEAWRSIKQIASSFHSSQ